MKRYYIFFAVLAVICAITILSNLAIRRGPVHDAQAANDIRQLQSSVDTYYLSHNQLPDSITRLQASGDITKRLRDYTYQTSSSTVYELCTTFMTKHTDSNIYYAPAPYPGSSEMPNPDNHGKGHVCFSYTVVPIGGYPYPLKGAPTR